MAPPRVPRLHEPIVAAFPGHELHVILDNLYTHKKCARWLKKHPKVRFHFMPTRSSWLNQIETWLSILQGQSLSGASFTSVEQLQEHIDHSSQPTMSKRRHRLERGGAEIGITQISEVLAEPKVDFVGPFPAEIQNYTVYVGAAPKNSQVPEATKALVDFVTSARAATVLKAKGFEQE